jgi:hypothetical protein
VFCGPSLFARTSRFSGDAPPLDARCEKKEPHNNYTIFRRVRGDLEETRKLKMLSLSFFDIKMMKMMDEDLN